MSAPTVLGNARRGFIGRIYAVAAEAHHTNLHPQELENRLIEMGFIEGAQVEILHEGAFGNDPIAVRLDNATVAIRRRDAMSIKVTPIEEAVITVV